MSEASTLSYKVYLEGGSGVREVRRFCIERSRALSFIYLKQKIQMAFPALQNKNFDVYWKDTEGDSVIISSDEELTIALYEITGDLRKLYVAIKPEENVTPDLEMNDLPQSTDGPAAHEGVTCDGCNKPVTGFRYKCLTCPDFDLCSTCEGIGVHEEHFMIRISKPIRWRSAYSRRLAHQMSKWTRQGERHHHQRHGSNMRGGAEQPSSESTGAQTCPVLQFQNTYPNWLDYLCNRFGEFVYFPEAEMPPKPKEATESANKSTAAGSAAPSTSANPSTSAKPSTSASAENAQQSQTGHSSDSFSRERDMGYLRNVGERVAALLDPLGIEVEIQIKDKDQKQSAEKEKPTEGAVQREEVEKTVQSEPMEVGQDTPSAPPEQLGSEAEGWTVVPPETVPFNAEETTSRNRDEMVSTPEETTLTRQIYPRLEDVIGRTHEFEQEATNIADPRVAETLSHLLAMGFTNEGGWLTHLISIKDGDIDSVLDVLLPAKK